jgi:TonB family protein
VLQKVDQDSVDFTVKGILQTVSLDDVETISFGGGGASARPTLSTKPAVEQPRITTVPKKPGPTPRSMVEPAPSTSQTIYPMTASLKPTITFREKARYTEEARSAGTQGTVVLQLIFNANGSISNIRVVQGLPHGLTDSAIDAAKKIRFDPATKDGRPVSVRGNLEYTFNP